MPRDESLNWMPHKIHVNRAALVELLKVEEVLMLQECKWLRIVVNSQGFNGSLRINVIN